MEKIMPLYNGKELWTYFFDKEKRVYNQYMYKMLDYPKHIIFDEEQIINTKNKWNNLFNNENDIYLEIGSGSGNFTVANAIKNPSINYIGVELRLKRLVYSAKKSEKSNLDNIVFIRKRAETLQEFIGKNELSGMYINFPDPWEGEEDKRIISIELFKDLDIVLKKGGMIFFKTDHTKYYEDVLNMIAHLDNYKVIYNTDDLHNSIKSKDNIMTEFESLFTYKHNIKTKYIEIKKV